MSKSSARISTVISAPGAPSRNRSGAPSAVAVPSRVAVTPGSSVSVKGPVVSPKRDATIV